MRSSNPPRGSYPWLAAALTTYVILRLPSLWEPHWYTDEAGYANTAWLMSHGLTLYGQVWNNKPPVFFALYQLVLWAFGPSEIGLHLASLIAGLIALMGIWRLARGDLGWRRAAAAVGLAALLLGTPLLDGDLALPENFLIAPAIWAMVFTVSASRRSRAPVAVGMGCLAGGLFAMAILIQQTALADCLAAAVWLAAASNRARLALVGMLAGALAVITAVMTPFVVAAGAHNVAFQLVTSFVGYTRQSLPLSWQSVLPRAIIAVAIAVGCCGAGALKGEKALYWLWLGLTAAAAVLPNRAYVHFSLPLVAPLVLLAAGSRWPTRLAREIGQRHRGLLLRLAAVAGTGMWTAMLVVGGQGGLNPVSYYSQFAAYAVGASSYVSWERSFGAGTLSQQEAASWIVEHKLSNVTATAWSADSWVLVLADLKPVTPAAVTYVNLAWFGAPATMARIESQQPVLIITGSQGLANWSEIKPLLRSSYRPIHTVGTTKVWELMSAIGQPVSNTR